MSRTEVLEQVEQQVRNAKVRNPIQRYELAKELIAQAYQAHGFVTSRLQIVHAANIMKARTAR